ncbi:16S rRNA (cytidine(1402)-2'-O)-methyltransferase [Pontivivens insulae]|uniref:Ribosomal RNA small subunit methyltransferase I n=1 Tax=Pontivivens insulae TaxID=1639689 RepID=A0A2R8AF83_9RHOB|nr:16S rRNA (cytidine(1402)-2'-O)-methyltransferase [Pontivivens insulae]RED12002.1 16S rRNA (cytidine1402-2'-O)-methyltransferase [Pontivivens insulae]SPF30758.1 Ribosomal RNA small subunit methyltransferase I [Pontivivens insulae]
MALEPALYLVATPIGTAADITLRALDILREADVLAAEDTRTLRRLMEIHGVPVAGRPMIPYHDHNGAAQRPRLLAALGEGKSVAYASDAGTPLIADPGYALARDVREAGHVVRSAPGASALLAALSVAGPPTDQFYFAGFAPTKTGARDSFLQALAAVPSTLVFYESPKRLAASLRAMADRLGGKRQVAICRELTKKFEEVRRGSLEELAETLAAEGPPKGEIVIVVGPPVTQDVDEAAIRARLAELLKTLSTKDAAQQIQEETGIPRKVAYQMALAVGRVR